MAASHPRHRQASHPARGVGCLPKGHASRDSGGVPFAPSRRTGGRKLPSQTGGGNFRPRAAPPRRAPAPRPRAAPPRRAPAPRPRAAPPRRAPAPRPRAAPPRRAPAPVPQFRLPLPISPVRNFPCASANAQRSPLTNPFQRLRTKTAYRAPLRPPMRSTWTRQVAPTHEAPSQSPRPEARKRPIPLLCHPHCLRALHARRPRPSRAASPAANLRAVALPAGRPARFFIAHFTGVHT